MARTVAVLPEGARITDFISLGVVSEKIPLVTVHGVLAKTGRQSQRQRNLPAHVMVYYVIALALYMEVSYGEVLRCLLEGLEWLGLEVRRIRTTGRSAISQARTRLGVEPLRKLYDEVVGPIATPETKGAWYRRWRLVSIDGTTLHTADTEGNQKAFGRPGASRGRSGFPQIRMVSLVENGTHVLFGARQGSYKTGESTLGPRGALPSHGGDAVHRGPGLLQLPAVEARQRDWSGSAVASQEEPPSALHRTTARWFLPEQGLRLRPGSAA